MSIFYIAVIMKRESINSPEYLYNYLENFLH